jgi:phosphocarrier protein HPr
MKEFTYIVKDELGIHARPAGMLVKLTTKFKSDVKIKKGTSEINLNRLIQLMSLQVKHGDEVTIKANGEDEDLAILEIEKFMVNNL